MVHGSKHAVKCLNAQFYPCWRCGLVTLALRAGNWLTYETMAVNYGVGGSGGCSDGAAASFSSAKMGTTIGRRSGYL